jgi:HlyD family secretion protein
MERKSAMKTWKKIAIGAGGAIVLGGIVLISVYQANKGVVTVQSGNVVRQDLTSLVTASGEIRPKTYTNVLGEGFGKITEIVMKEGDHVKRGDVLLRLESIQPGADVEAQMANINSSEAAVKAAEANYRSAQATLVQRQADLEKAKFDWERSQGLYKAQLIAKQEYDARKAAYDGAAAGVDAAQAQLAQTKATLEQTRSMLDQSRAILVHQKDVLRKTTYRAPIDGLVSYIAVRVGENVVPGIQNATGSYLMTISDMSVVTAEVKVDETDIVNVRKSETADVTIDAVPGKSFAGHVTAVGDQAILRSSGLATTQTEANTQEARDFKVVVTIENPPDSVRPGLSVTAKIKTAEKKNVVTIPLQALAMRSQRDLDEAAHAAKGGSVTLAASKPASPSATKSDIQGVFVIRGKKAEFVPVQTGITGVTDIEITSGLKEGDEIVTGSYKALRSLKPGASVKVDNSAPKREEESTS